MVVQASLFAGAALIFQTSLDYLGIGTQPPTASWGGMAAEASTYVSRDPWLVVPAGFVITLTSMSFGLIGDTVRDWYAWRSAVMPSFADSETAPSFVGQDGGSVPPAVTPPRRSVELLPTADGSRSIGPDDDVLLRVEDLTVSVRSLSGRTVPLVDRVSFRVGAGEALGIVGESGCGKTMTALAIMGLLPRGVSVEAGSIWLNGVELTRADEHAMRRVRGSVISMISQEPIACLDPCFTVGSQLTEVIRRHSRVPQGEAHRDMNHLLEMVELSDTEAVSRKYPHELSGGMAQRVAIAAALAGKPKLLVADEPTTALDVTVQAEILELLRSLRSTSRLGLLLVSHDWGVIADGCDAAVVMYGGEVVESAKIETILRQPRHPYTRALMASNPHYASARRARLDSIPGSVPPLGLWPAGCHFAPRCAFATPECRQGPSLRSTSALRIEPAASVPRSLNRSRHKSQRCDEGRCDEGRCVAGCRPIDCGVPGPVPDARHACSPRRELLYHSR